MKNITKSGIQIALVLVLTLLLVLGMGTSVAQAASDNQVEAKFFTGQWHSTDADSVENGLLPGSYMVIGASITNTPDGTGESVITPTSTYNPAAGLNIGFCTTDYLVPGGPPYIWNFPDIIENDGNISFAERIVGEPFEFVPGLSASQSISQTEFTAPGTQTVIVSAVAAEEMDSLQLYVSIRNGQDLNAAIIGASGDGDVKFAPDGMAVVANIPNPAIGTLYSLEVGIALAPEPEALPVTYKPIVRIGAHHNTAAGDEIAGVLDKSFELGTWSIETPEEYSWHWVEEQVKGIIFPGVNEFQGYNQVEAAFTTGYVHVPATDSVENGLLPGSYKASTVNIRNTPDGTAANVIGSTLTYIPAEEVNVVPIPQYLIPGGPPYIWQFPEIIEDKEYGAGSRQIFVEPFEFTPGVSASYSVSQTVFTGPGIQTVTVSAVPAEEMDELRLTVIAIGDSNLHATITGASGDGDVGVTPGGWGGGAVINNPTVGMSYSVEVTIALAPGPDVLSFTYKPNVHVVNNSITTAGDEIASVLNKSSELGAWSVETPEDYSWHQVEYFHKRITFPGVIGVPPGLDFIEIDHMRIEYDTRPNRDKIKIMQAELGLEPGASYDLDVDDVVVNIDGVVITIPAGSFKKHGRRGGYSYDSKGHSTPKIHMELDFEKGEWSLTVEDIDAGIIDNSDGVDVTLQIGYMQASQNVPMWIDYLVYPPQPPDHSGHH